MVKCLAVVTTCEYYRSVSTIRTNKVDFMEEVWLELKDLEN